MKALLLVVALWANVTFAADTANLHERDTPIPKPFFGLVIHYLLTTTAWPQVPFGSWRIWDSAVKWNDIQPEPGPINFDKFDKEVALGQQHGVEMIYTLGQTPRWASSAPDEKQAWGYGTGAMPRDVEDYRRYVEAVVQRYRGRIAAYEVWNEPKYKQNGVCKGSIFFCGTPQELVQLTRVAHDAIKRLDPAAKLATPGFTDGLAGVKRLDEYLAAGAAPYVDAISFHFYTAQPEESWQILAALREVMRKHGLASLPIWNTEEGFLVQNRQHTVVTNQTSGPFGKVYAPSEAAGLLARTFLFAASGGVDRVYWYSWDNKRMGAIDSETGKPNDVGIAYGTVERWLIGSTVSCSGSGGVWACTLQRGGRTAEIAWSSNDGTSVANPADGFVERLDGSRVRLNKGAVLAPPGDPALISQDGQPW